MKQGKRKEHEDKIMKTDDLPNKSCQMGFNPMPAKFGLFSPNRIMNCNIKMEGFVVNCK